MVRLTFQPPLFMGSTQMAAIEIIGDDNHVLIDDEFKNMILAAKGVISFPASGAPIIGSLASFSYTSTSPIPPLLAVYSTFPVIGQALVKSGNTYTWYIASSASGRGGTAEAYIFHLPETVPNAGGLLQLFNTQGVLVFDSNLKYAKVERNINYTLAGNLSFPVTPGRKYACVTSTGAGQFQQVPYPPLTRPPLYGVSEQGSRSGFYMTNGLIRTEQFGYSNRNYATTTPPGGSYVQANGTLLAIDVTGL